MKKLDFTKLTILGIDDKPIKIENPELNQAIGNALYGYSNSIAIAELGKRIFNGEEVEFRDEEIVEVVSILQSDNFPYIPMIKRQVLEFIGKN